MSKPQSKTDLGRQYQMPGYTRGHKRDIELGVFDPTLSNADVEANRLIVDSSEAVVEADHTPEGWLPRNQRPGYVSDWRKERRSL